MLLAVSVCLYTSTPPKDVRHVCVHELGTGLAGMLELKVWAVALLVLTGYHTVLLLLLPALVPLVVDDHVAVLKILLWDKAASYAPN